MKTMTLETTGNPEQVTPKKIPARGANWLRRLSESTATSTRSSVCW